jgi:hypothetical protein
LGEVNPLETVNRPRIYRFPVKEIEIIVIPSRLSNFDKITFRIFYPHVKLPDYHIISKNCKQFFAIIIRPDWGHPKCNVKMLREYKRTGSRFVPYTWDTLIADCFAQQNTHLILRKYIRAGGIAHAPPGRTWAL